MNDQYFTVSLGKEKKSFIFSRYVVKTKIRIEISSHLNTPIYLHIFGNDQSAHHALHNILP
jgi:hypothetical protein